MTRLRGMLSTAEDGSIGFDCNQVLSASQVKAFVAVEKMKFAFRYVSRDLPAPAGDLSRNESEVILSNGLGIGIVQHVSRENWDSNGEKGRRYGMNAAQQVLDMGYPPGMHVWCDLEGVIPTDPDKDVIDFCTAWYRAVDSANLNPGLYAGWHTLLSGTQLYNLPFKSYWSAYNLNQDEFPNPRGVQIKQGIERSSHGVKYDPDTVSADKMGDRCWFYWPLP